MKCPKCNYVSHDYLDDCRKCGIDLVAFKHEIGLLVLQPGVLDLSLVLGGAGADDFFESVEEEVIMHAGDDDDFDISLDDYVEQPTSRRPAATAPRGGGRPDDVGGLDHLTLELDAADLPADLTARLRASQVLPATPTMSPPRTPAVPPGGGEDTLPGPLTLDMRRDSISGELPPEMRDAAARLAALSDPKAPAPSVSQDTRHISRVLGLGVGISTAAAAAVALPQNTPAAPETPEASQPLPLSSADIDLSPTAPRAELVGEEEASEAATVVNISGPMPSLQLHDVSLVEETETDTGLLESGGIDPSMPTIELLDVDAAVAQMDAELRDEPPDVADAASTLLKSFALTVDDPGFAMGGASEHLGEVPEAPHLGLDIETDLDSDLASMSSHSLLEDTAFLPDTATSFPELDTAALDASSMALDAIGDDETLPGHLTLELQASELPPALAASHMFDEATLEVLPEPQAFPEATPPHTTHPVPSADAVALEDMAEPAETGLGPVTLELDLSDLPDLASITLEELQLEEPPGELRSSRTTPSGERQLHEEEELLLDLDDFEFADEDDEQR